MRVLVKDNKIRLGDGSNNTTLSSAASGGSLNLVLPSSSGTSGQYLKTDGSGNLNWNTIDIVQEGNTSVETIDTGTDGHIKFTTELNERMRIDKDGYIGIGTQIPSKNLQVIGDEGLETGYNGESVNSIDCYAETTCRYKFRY